MNNFFQETKNNIIEEKPKKTLPNSFASTDDEMSLGKSLLLSAILHPTVIILSWLAFMGLTLIGLLPDEFNKPNLRVQDIEFVIVNKEAEPINKNTRYRSDKNSRAGGIHDPKRKVSEPSPAPAPAGKKTKAKASSGGSAKKITAPKTTVAQAPVVSTVKKPTRSAAPKPSYKPSLAPSTNIPKPQMPKLTQNPKSPFSVAVPKTNLPKGPIPSTSNGTGKTGGQLASSGTGRGVGMPSPQFSTGKGTGTGSGTGRGTGMGTGTGSGGGGKGGTGTGGDGRGGYGTGGWGNPGPGNPSGPPGIDAIKQPDWGPYMRELERRIKRNWNPPKGDVSKRVVMLFTIGRDGRLVSIKTLKSSGQAESDRAAKAAVELTAPFKSLPPEYKGNNIDIEFTFDYNVLGARSYR